MAIAIRIAGIGHLLILFFVLKKQLECLVDSLFVCTYKLESSGINTFWSLGGIPPDENRNTIGRTLSLDSARISETQIRTSLENEVAEYTNIPRNLIASRYKKE